MPTQTDVVQQMLQALSLSEPSLDTTIGSPIRSILDVVSEAIAECYADQYFLSYQPDIDSKSGADLDNYLAQFGFTRLPGTRATGSVTFSRTSAAPKDILISAGTQVTTNDTPSVIFNTLTPVILAQGTISCSVPVQAQIAGTSGNVAASSIVNVASLQMGFSSLTNPSGCNGGANPESDDQLRTRFVATVFRALTGTEQMFLAVGLEDPDVSQANVVGAEKTYDEMIDIEGGYALSSVQDFAYLYPDTSVLGVDIYNGDIATPLTDYTLTSVLIDPTSFGLAVTDNATGGVYDHSTATTVEYQVVARTSSGQSLPCAEVTGTLASGAFNSFSLSWNDVYPAGTILSWDIYINWHGSGFQWLTDVTATSYLDTGRTVADGVPPVVNNAYTQPVIAVLNPTALPDGVYELQYDYLPTSSRNNPAAGITNRVDVFVNGQRPIEVTQDSQYTTAYVFNRHSNDPLNVDNFQRNDGTNPRDGNFFVPFAYSPVIDASLSGTIIIGANTYHENTDYWTVNNTTAFGLGPLSLAGIEFLSSANGQSVPPTSGTAMNLDYSFNQIPSSVQAGIANWGLVTTDVQVHQAKILSLNLYLGIILSNNSYSRSSVLSQIQASISNYLSSLTYDGVVQISEIIAIVQNLSGITAVRLLNSADDTGATYPTNASYDGTNYAIQSVNDENVVITTYSDGSTPHRAIDVPLNDDTLASLSNVYLSFYANNTFGAV